MPAIVFAGPSLRDADRRANPRLEFAPPAGRGDIFRAVSAGYRLIGLIDGTFETRMSPWHKEILWALSEGITILGAASLGALRAVEMRKFGMIGVGRIYRGFLSGALVADDEVAVVHAPAALGYVPLTVALVNMRSTFDHARRERVICGQTAEGLLAAATALFFKDRNYDRVIARARISGLDRSELDRFERWWPDRSVDVKRADACQLLRRLQRPIRRRMGPPKFVPTSYWKCWKITVASRTTDSPDL